MRPGHRAVLLIAPLALGLGGCASAGFMVAGPLFSMVAAVADRSVERTLPADRALGWNATVDTLSRMGIQIRDAERSAEAWTAKGAGDKVSVNFKLEPVTSGMSRLTLRVESGGLTADKKTADEIVNQVGATLSAWAATSPAEGSGDRAAADRKSATEAISALKQEVARLGDRIQKTGKPERAPAADSAPARPALLDSGGIVLVPTTVGVPSAPAPQRPAVESDRVEPAALAPGHSPAPSAAESPVVAARRREDAKAPAEQDILPVPLNPVGSLSPVEALGIRRSAQ